MITGYKPSIFNNLNQFHAAKKQLEDSRDFIPRLGAVICKHELQQTVGLTLLHKHFDLAHDERLVEKLSNNTINITPVTNCKEEALLPYTWKFVTNDAKAEFWSPLEFQDESEATSASVQASKTLAAKADFLLEMALTLQKLKLENVFGVSVLHRESIVLQEGQIRLETTDHDSRTLTISAVNQNTIEFQELTETLWYFTANSDFKISGLCGSHCFSHCVSHD